ncbi:MAG: tRNA threonylcarbamoyladenosine biosynthesis protein TsaE [Chlamydiae bacterium]|nr:tRNA threonylcarbamoyladenosine biosynthesis protein TsaE [Chlamydiota bacterium]
MGRERIELAGAQATIDFGIKIGETLPKQTLVAFFGELGAGKTTLIKGIVEGTTGISRENVSSPTFNYLNIYEGKKGVCYHFDLYRLQGVDEFLSLGFEEYFLSEGICLIEWSEKIVSLLPPKTHFFTLEHAGVTSRILLMEKR